MATLPLQNARFQSCFKQLHTSHPLAFFNYIKNGTDRLCSNLAKHVSIKESKWPLSTWLGLAVALIVGALGGRYAFQQTQLAKTAILLAEWTPKKDWHEFCMSQEQALVLLNNSGCKLVINQTLPPLPYLDFERRTRSLGLDLRDMNHQKTIFKDNSGYKKEIVALTIVTTVLLAFFLRKELRRTLIQMWWTAPSPKLFPFLALSTKSHGTVDIFRSSPVRSDDKQRWSNSIELYFDSGLRRRRGRKPSTRALATVIGSTIIPKATEDQEQRCRLKRKTTFFVGIDEDYLLPLEPCDATLGGVHALAGINDPILCSCRGWCDNAVQSAAEYRQIQAFEPSRIQSEGHDTRGARPCNFLYAAAARGRSSFLPKGYDLNAEAGYAGSAIQVAALHGHKHTVELLIDAGADINTEGGLGINALDAAAAEGHSDVVRFLLARNAKTSTLMQNPRLRRAYQTAFPDAFTMVIGALRTHTMDIPGLQMSSKIEMRKQLTEYVEMHEMQCTKERKVAFT